MLVAALLLAAVQTPSPPGSRFELRSAPLVDLWLEVRALAEAEGAPGDETLVPAVAAMRALERALGAGNFGMIEANLEDCADAEALAAAFADLPERTTLREGGPEVELRAPAVRAAAAVAEIEPRWRAEAWPAREKEIALVMIRLRERLDAEREAAIFKRLAANLGVRIDDVRVPVYLVTRAPWPGAFTHRRIGGGGITFVGIEEDVPYELLETVVHESIHTLDLLTPDNRSLLVELRQRLSAAGVDPRTARSWVHGLFFYEAAACVRAFYDPDYVDYGERRGVYARLRDVCETEAPLWEAYTTGLIDRDRVVAAILEAAIEPAPEPEPTEDG